MAWSPLALGPAAVFAQEAPVSTGDEGREEQALLLEDTLILGEEIPRGVSQSSSVFAIIRMVLALGLAAAAVYGVVYLLRRAAKPQDSRNSHLRILTSAHLGSNRYLYVVSIGSNAWLVGAGEGGLSLIAELDDQEAIDSMLLEESKNGADSSRILDFRSLLRRFKAGGNSLSGDAAERTGFSADAIRKNRERLKRL